MEADKRKCQSCHSSFLEYIKMYKYFAKYGKICLRQERNKDCDTLWKRDKASAWNWNASMLLIKNKQNKNGFFQPIQEIILQSLANKTLLIKPSCLLPSFPPLSNFLKKPN